MKSSSALWTSQISWMLLALWLGYHSYTKGEKLKVKETEIVQSEVIGRKIGRNAMLLYLNRTNQTDSIKINILELLTIEDSLSIHFKKIE